MSEACVFCAIVARSSPASFVAESAGAIAILTIGPIRTGHTLVLPKRHVVEFPDATAAELAEVMDLASEVARLQRRAFDSTGETLFLASGAAGEQSVFHLHLHVVPRREGDGLDLTSWWQSRMESPKPERDVLDSIAERLRRDLPTRPQLPWG
jgi:histidine triad (HIT) family protein